jgi:hypothetical protein
MYRELGVDSNITNPNPQRPGAVRLLLPLCKRRQSKPLHCQKPAKNPPKARQKPAKKPTHHGIQTH